jgi:hypothetical protein
MLPTALDPHCRSQVALKFKARAEECRRLADMTDEASRSGFLKVARDYDALADESPPKTRSVSPAAVVFYFSNGMMSECTVMGTQFCSQDAGGLPGLTRSVGVSR